MGIAGPRHLFKCLRTSDRPWRVFKGAILFRREEIQCGCKKRKVTEERHRKRVSWRGGFARIVNSRNVRFRGKIRPTNLDRA